MLQISMRVQGKEQKRVGSVTLSDQKEGVVRPRLLAAKPYKEGHHIALRVSA